MLVKLFIFLIRIYKILISPLLGNCCRFYPTCSDYVTEAFKAHGFFKGALLGIKRLLKCHPFHRGGYDPVMKRKDAKAQRQQKD